MSSEIFASAKKDSVLQKNDFLGSSIESVSAPQWLTIEDKNQLGGGNDDEMLTTTTELENKLKELFNSADKNGLTGGKRRKGSKKKYRKTKTAKKRSRKVSKKRKSKRSKISNKSGSKKYKKSRKSKKSKKSVSKRRSRSKKSMTGGARKKKTGSKESNGSKKSGSMKKTKGSKKKHGSKRATSGKKKDLPLALKAFNKIVVALNAQGKYKGREAAKYGGKLNTKHKSSHPDPMERANYIIKKYIN